MDFYLLKDRKIPKRAYARDISDAFSFLNVRNTRELGQIRFHDLVIQIQKHLNSSSEFDDSTNRVLNPTTVNRKAYAISSFFKYLIHSYGYPKNPLDQYQAHKVDKKSKTKSLTRAEVLDVVSFMVEKRDWSQTAFRGKRVSCQIVSTLVVRPTSIDGLYSLNKLFNIIYIMRI